MMYHKVLILHSLDESTKFLKPFEDHFPDYYISVDDSDNSVQSVKTILSDLDETSFVIYIGHGSSEGLFLPNENFEYANLFLDAKWSNIYFENHDILLLSCRSNELLERIYKYNSAIGFGNIISSAHEIKQHNERNEIKKTLSNTDIDIFNAAYVKVSISIIKMILNNTINFSQAYKYYYYLINKEINNILMNKKINNRIEIARLLFEFRNEMVYKSNH
ncbi:hypothetical protein SAMN04487893_104181 [Myroides guanonis]|uniref:CHAT domain-containing protein n=2 Tax=Myroides guanonis TaxID=1150112 RepID=A0A1I3PMS6_9FLAO|nr:hypothetical protein SAMN04487893_104181 [Myroides guanonis]